MFYAVPCEQWQEMRQELQETRALLAELLRVLPELTRPPQYHTAAAAAKLLGTTPTTISNLVTSGQLPVLMLGSREYRISRRALNDLEARR